MSLGAAARPVPMGFPQRVRRHPGCGGRGGVAPNRARRRGHAPRGIRKQRGRAAHGRGGGHCAPQLAPVLRRPPARYVSPGCSNTPGCRGGRIPHSVIMHPLHSVPMAPVCFMRAAVFCVCLCSLFG